ncbi:hypothetical protein [Nocardia acidivorans]|uniref:hypothetical protein n=1 Tax=Nocardia acidivorans TaxID=404580 RepID=UPI000B0EDEA7|nr:hypothetical protein [Nocardia acidivorans]
MNEHQNKDANARVGGPIGFQHSDNGLRPIDAYGWPASDEDMRELDQGVRETLQLLGDDGEVIDVDPESVVDIEPTEPDE